MSVLIIAEHDNATLKPATLHVVTAAQKIGGDIHILVAGQGVDGAAAAAAKVAGVAKVVKADDAAYAHQLAENVAKLIVALAPNYSHVLAAATVNDMDGSSLLEVWDLAPGREEDEGVEEEGMPSGPGGMLQQRLNEERGAHWNPFGLLAALAFDGRFVAAAGVGRTHVLVWDSHTPPPPAPWEEAAEAGGEAE